MTNNEYACIHEEQIQGISRKTAELEARADYKDQRINEINTNLKEMDRKIDELNNNVNKLVLQSKTDDKELELRLKAIETELELQKQVTKDNYTKTSLIIAGITVIFVVLTFYFNFLK